MNPFVNALILASALTVGSQALSQTTDPQASNLISPRADLLCAAILEQASRAGERIKSTTVAARAALAHPINQLRTRIALRGDVAAPHRPNRFATGEESFSVDTVRGFKGSVDTELAELAVAEAMHERLQALEVRLARSTPKSAPVQQKIVGTANIRAYLENVLASAREGSARARVALATAASVDGSAAPAREPSFLTTRQKWGVFFGYVATSAGLTAAGHAVGGPVVSGLTAVGLTGAWWMVRDHVFNAVRSTKTWIMTRSAERTIARRQTRLAKLEDAAERAERQVINANVMLATLDNESEQRSIVYEYFPVSIGLDPDFRGVVSAAAIRAAVDKGISPTGPRSKAFEVHNLLFHNGHSWEFHGYVMKRRWRDLFSAVFTAGPARTAKPAAKILAESESDVNAPTTAPDPSGAPDSAGSKSPN